jgi:hypothetical protein
MRSHPSSYLLLTATLCLPLACLPAGPAADADVKADIVVRCHYTMGEFGPDGVQTCVEGELAALQALAAYPEDTRPILGRCTRQWELDSWHQVKRCADEEIAAHKALAQYPKQRQALLDECWALEGERGAAQVKACVDRRIAAEGATPSQ